MLCIGARERCACITILTMPASTVCEPTRCERMTSAPLVLSVAPIKGSPARLVTGSGSPVSMDSSTALAPSMHDAIDRDLLARPNPQRVSHLDVG